MRVIGICRFSYPALGGFKRMHDSVEAREAYLYAPERLALRFAHFEALTLPSIRAQTDPDFTFLIVTGETLPAPWLARLREITADVPQAKIVQIPPARLRLAMHDVIQQELGEEAGESLQFRLDDDDAVGVDFVRQLRKLARTSERMRRHWKNTVFDFNRGYSVQLSQDGIALQETIGNFLACGLAATFSEGDGKSIMSFAHHKMHHKMPALIVPFPHMYLRACHSDNDSAAHISPETPATLDADQRTALRDLFNVDEDHVRALFSALGDARGTA